VRTTHIYTHISNFERFLGDFGDYGKILRKND